MSGQPQFLANESQDLRDQALRDQALRDQALCGPAPHQSALTAPGLVEPASHPPPSSITSGNAAPVWLQRLSLFILVLFCVYLGVLVMVLPWWSRIWDHNALMDAHPAVAAFLRNGAVRGIISGFGLLDIWIGISEAVHYHDYRG